MLLFAHTGLTLGCAILVDLTLKKLSSNKSLEEKYTLNNVMAGPNCCNTDNKQNNSLNSKISIQHIDYRLIIFGSLLPDMIDKPLGLAILSDFFHSSRIISHTLLFLIVITLTGIFLIKKHGDIRLLLIAFGVLFHFILDQIWLMPQTFLWPLNGISFQPTETYHWFAQLLYVLKNNVVTLIGEIIGFILLLTVLIYMIIKRKLLLFIKKGIII